ncbi:twin-arginine translocase TatA/TatE family subunit [uncultured Tessaracoccus sp.]|uniref:Sec-independent protein translocase subunit TatA/TatB n=1 Tax=uncultured Tessaracoccus sp. TaxID=905023 RepID=UPI0025E531FC|nr:twin-arginine translocase TatA/TatE family subunit [uncultured Tessaracoccus sp.]
MALGWPEAIIILIVALVLFGGSRLAGVGKGVGRSIREFKDEVSQGQQSVDAPQTQQPQGTAQPTRPDQPGATPVDDPDLPQQHQQ